jgi:hypothetical protein
MTPTVQRPAPLGGPAEHRARRLFSAMSASNCLMSSNTAHIATQAIATAYLVKGP